MRLPKSFLRNRGVAAFLLLVLVACTGCPPKPSNEIVLGHYGSMTGSEATFGQSTDKGVKLALKELNAAGGVKGKQVKLLTYDDKGNNTEAGTAVTRLVSQDQVTAIIGEVASGISLTGAPICQDGGVPMVSPSSTNPDVTKVGDMIFRVCFIDPFQGAVCAKFARENEKINATKAAILYDQKSPYSVGLWEEFSKAFKAAGGEVVEEQRYQAGDQDFSAQLTAIRGSGAEVIFIPGYYTEAANIAVQARKIGIKVPLLGADGWDSAKLAEIGGEAMNNTFYSNHYSQEDPSPRVQEFIAKFKAENKGETPDGLAALGYDAARILCLAIEKAPSLSGKDIAAELAKTADFDGVTGKITIDKDRNAVKPAVILEMKDGVAKFVTSVTP